MLNRVNYHLFDPLLDLEYDHDLALYKCRHYLSFIGSQQCGVSLYLKRKQKSPTSVHHVRRGGIARKCSDFETIPLAIDLHTTGERSLNVISARRMEEELGIPPMEWLALQYLAVYIDNPGVHNRVRRDRAGGIVRPQKGAVDGAIKAAQSLILFLHRLDESDTHTDDHG